MLEPPIVTILLAACVLLLFLLLVVALRISGSLRRMENGTHPAPADGGDGRGRAADEPDTAAGGAFDEFLKEDPARRNLTKSEQFAAFRRWRQERGMNWSKP